MSFALSMSFLQLHANAHGYFLHILFLPLLMILSFQHSLQNGLTALHKAIIGKKQAITSYLLRESANPFVRDEVSLCLRYKF